MAGQKVSLDSQIAAVAAARAKASALHPGRAHADLLAKQLQAAEASLRWLRQWQDVCRKAVADAKQEGGG